MRNFIITVIAVVFMMFVSVSANAMLDGTLVVFDNGETIMLDCDLPLFNQYSQKWELKDTTTDATFVVDPKHAHLYGPDGQWVHDSLGNSTVIPYESFTIHYNGSDRTDEAETASFDKVKNEWTFTIHNLKGDVLTFHENGDDVYVTNQLMETI